MHHSCNQIQRCKIQRICNVIQNLIGNGDVIKYKYAECTNGTVTYKDVTGDADAIKYKMQWRCNSNTYI